MPFIDVIQHENAEGELKEIYDNLVESRGKLAEVHKIQSLNPKSIINHMDLYLTIMFAKSPLKRYQREMIAVIVSISNNCEYCQIHHAEALMHYWKNDEKLSQLKKNYRSCNLSEIDLALCEYAEKVTLRPSDNNKENVDKLRALNLDDRAILDTTLIVSYFNFVNRMVLSLGVSVEEQAGGYNY